MYAVFPVALSSCTMPDSIRFLPAATGMTRRPSLIDGVAPGSSTPFSIPRATTLFITPDNEACDEAIWRRISAKTGDALSEISPYLFTIVSIPLIIRGNESILPNNEASCGKSGISSPAFSEVNRLFILATVSNDIRSRYRSVADRKLPSACNDLSASVRS